VSKDGWDIKEGTGKSMKNALMYSGMEKGTSLAEATPINEKIKPVAFTIVELWESEGIRQADKQLVS